MSKHKPPIKLIYIAGNGRSGSTLLARMLGELDNLVSIGEFKHIWHRNFQEDQLCSCGLPFSQCSFWQAVVTQASEKLGPIDGDDVARLQSSLDRIRHIPNMIFPSQDFRARLSRLETILAQFFAAIQDVSGESVIIDASKEVSRLFLYDAMTNIDLYVIHLVRDSRGVAFSWQRKRVRPEITDRITYMDLYSPFKAGRRWLFWNAVAELFAKKAKDRYFLLRYEDLITNPEASLQRIVTKFGFDTADLSFIRDQELAFMTEEHSIAGNPNRFQKGSMQLKLDMEWQKAMKQRDWWVVTGLTWPLLWKYGYLGKTRSQ